MSRLADLAQANLVAIGDGRVEIGFEARHFRDQPGILRSVMAESVDNLFADYSGDASELLQTLCAASYGVGVVFGTRAKAIAAESDGRPISLTRVEMPESVAGFRRDFVGAAASNPTLLYQGRAGLEGLVVIDSRPVAPNALHGVKVRQVVRMISDIAYRKLTSPILSLQAPVQVPKREPSIGHTSRGSEKWVRTYSIAVRFTISAGDLTAEVRKVAIQDLLDYCESNGFGLALVDPRPSHRNGNWFWLAEAANDSAILDQPDTLQDPIYSVYPLTFVGPARLGSTAAIMRCLDEYSDLPIISCAVTSLSDLAFISMSIGLPLSRDRAISASKEAWIALRDAPRAPMLASLSGTLVGLQFRRQLSNGALDELASRARDYILCHGPVVKVNHEAMATRAMWFFLETPNLTAGLRVGLEMLYSAVRSALARVAASANGGAFPPADMPLNIEYLIARASSAGGLRVRGKVSLHESFIETVLPNQMWEERATTLCRLVEEEWSLLLSREAEPYRASVAWRESWLGHWSGRSVDLG